MKQGQEVDLNSNLAIQAAKIELYSKVVFEGAMKK